MRLVPPDKHREPINIHPTARHELRELLTHELDTTGVGYSEFIRNAITTFRLGQWEIEGVERPKLSDFSVTSDN